MDPEAVDEWIRVLGPRLVRRRAQLARGGGPASSAAPGGTTVWARFELAKKLGPGQDDPLDAPDSGRSYLSKFYDDNWMLEHGFVERRTPLPTVEQLLASKRAEETVLPDLVTISSHQKVGEAIDVMQRYSISQLPVVRDGRSDSLADFIGSLPGSRRCSTASSRTRTRCTRTSRPQCSRRWRRSKSHRHSTRSSRRSRGGRTPSSSRATEGPSAS
jgi:cystathionine beta-synthase